jgi:hypothetical protein
MRQQQPLADRPLDRPHPSRLSPDEPHFEVIMRAHRTALDAGAPGYFDPLTRLYVMTAKHHADRGSCCNSGCRHCPYV